MDLQGLKLALDTNRPELYNGDWGDVIKELVDELEETRLILERGAYTYDENLPAMVQDVISQRDEWEEKYKDLKDTKIQDVVYTTCKIVGIEKDSQRKKTFENTDGEHPVRVVAYEMEED